MLFSCLLLYGIICLTVSWTNRTIFYLLCAWSDVLIFSTDRARDEVFNSTADAVSIKNGINATHSGREFNLTFYLGIYSGKPSIPMFISTNV